MVTQEPSKGLIPRFFCRIKENRNEQKLMNMKKRTLQFRMTVKALMIVLLLGVVEDIYAYDFSAVCETGQTLYYTITHTANHYVKLVCPGSNGWSGYIKPTGNIVLPETVQYNGVSYTITSIGDYAFYTCSGLTGNLTIPNSITTIGNRAFSSCSGLTGNLIIPNSVTSIEQWAFSGCTGLTGSLTIPYSVTSLGQFAFNCGFTEVYYDAINCADVSYSPFYNCSGSLTIGDNVERIPAKMFQECSGFTGSLIIGNSVTSIGDNAFSYCSNFESIEVGTDNVFYDSRNDCNALISANTNELILGCKNTIIPNSVASIGNRAFVNCSGLTGNLTIPNSVITIGEYAFSYCTGITGSLTIPNSVITIGEYAFFGCNGFIGDLTIGNSVTTIGSYAFSGCIGFTGNLIIPNSVTTIGINAFRECINFTGNLIIGNSVTTICDWAFGGCNGFTGGLTIPNTVISIGNFAFKDCNGFTGSLTIGNSVSTIGTNAFKGCSGISFIVCLPETPPQLSNSNSFEDWNINTSVCVPCGFEGAYSSQSWGGFNNFYGLCAGMVAVEPNPTEGGVVTGGGAFDAGQTCTIMATANDGYVFAKWTCGNLSIPTTAEITIFVAGDMIWMAHFVPNANIDFADAVVKNICVSHWDTNGDGELSYLEAAGVRDLCNYFNGNTEITSFDEFQYFIGMTTVGDSAFSGCTGLVSIELPNSLTIIDERAFYNCRALTGSLNIPNSVTTICDYAFYGLIGFTGGLTIPNSVTTIGNYAFYGCKGFTGNIPNSVTTIGDYAFVSIENLTSVTIGNSVTSIGKWAFYENDGLTSLYIPSSVTDIGESILCGCDNITQIVVSPENPIYDSRNNCNAIIKTSENELVQGCKNTIIPTTVTSIGNSSFRMLNSLTSINISNSVTSIGDYAFSSCNSLVSVIIPNTVTSISYNAFQFCDALSELALGNALELISFQAFWYCNGLTSVIIPNSLTAIKDQAFYGCPNLTSVVIGTSVNQLSYGAFSYCSNLSSAYFLASTPPNLYYDIFEGANSNFRIYVPYGLVDTYKNGIGWNRYRNKIQAIPYCSRFITAGDWSVSSNWASWNNPWHSNAFVCIEENAELSENKTIGNLSISAGKTLTIKSGASLTVTENIILPANTAIIIEDGAQLIHNSINAEAIVHKTITPYVDNQNDNWHLIATPIANNSTITSVDNLLSNNYDLYKYEEPTALWMNQKADDSSFVELEAGRGYLYANSEEVDLKFAGTLNGGTTTIVIPLSYTNGINHPGFNFVGNPFPCNAYLDREYYVLTAEGTSINPVAVPASTPIPPCTGVMVKANGPNETVVFTRVVP